VKNGNKLAKKGFKFGDDLAALGAKSLDDIASGVSTQFGLRMIGSIASKAGKFLPVIGWIIGFAFDFFMSEILDAQKVEEMLVASMMKSGEIATAADDIRNGTVPEEDDEGNYVSGQLYLESIAMQNIYRSYDSPDEAGISSIGSSVYAASGNCSSISRRDYESDEEYYAAVKACLGLAKDNIASLSKNTTVGSSFFTNTPLQAEFDPNFAVSENDSEYYRGVPKLIARYVGKDTTFENFINALISSFTIVGPKDIEDILEGTFNTEELNPTEIGGTSMYQFYAECANIHQLGLKRLYLDIVLLNHRFFLVLLCFLHLLLMYYYLRMKYY
ncbi:hypothetical protein LJC64_05420, partial [Ruminococcaceae bacterium OttesenSCG-928-A11]|nr:hypothetical protein [Ruminococcaceae bacterium OttesenSCG-928-A11]